jgi:hypothetical protein
MQSEFFGVGNIAIVCHTDPIWIIRVQGLSFGTRTGSGSWIPDVGNAEIAAQFDHVMRLKYVLDETVIFAQMQSSTFRRDHARRILTSMLQNR